jgi:hypothetical protein
MRLEFFSAFVSFACLGLAVTVNVSASLEYELKAAFLLRFANYVEWPSSAFGSDEEPLVFGVFGSDPFGGALEAAAKGKMISGRHVQIRVSSDPNVLRACHIIFFPASQMRGYGVTVSALSGLSVLTVGEVSGFTDHGGIINFVMQEDHLRFEINQATAVGHHLKVSSRLLQLSVGAGHER